MSLTVFHNSDKIWNFQQKREQGSHLYAKMIWNLSSKECQHVLLHEKFLQGLENITVWTFEPPVKFWNCIIKSISGEKNYNVKKLTSFGQKMITDKKCVFLNYHANCIWSCKKTTFKEGVLIKLSEKNYFSDTHLNRITLRLSFFPTDNI